MSAKQRNTITIAWTLCAALVFGGFLLAVEAGQAAVDARVAAEYERGHAEGMGDAGGFCAESVGAQLGVVETSVVAALDEARTMREHALAVQQETRATYAAVVSWLDVGVGPREAR